MSASSMWNGFMYRWISKPQCVVKKEVKSMIHYIKYNTMITVFSWNHTYITIFQKKQGNNNTKFNIMVISGWERKRYLRRGEAFLGSFRNTGIFLYPQLCSGTWIFFLLLFFKTCKYGIHLYMYISQLILFRKFSDF